MQRLSTKAILALVECEGDVKAAAAQVGIHEATLVRWLKDESFAALYDRARTRYVETRAEQLGRQNGEPSEATLGMWGDPAPARKPAGVA